MILREVKINFKSILLWSLGFYFMIVYGMAEYQAFNISDDPSIKHLMDSIPRIIRIIFGMDGIDLTLIEGYFGLILLYVLIMVAIHGGFIGYNLIHREIKDHTSESLFVKPKSRSYLLLQKLVGGFVVVFILETIIIACMAHVLESYGAWSTLWKAVVATLITHIVFYLLGFSFTLFLKETKRAQSFILFFILIGYLSLILSAFLEQKWIQSITPIGYYGANYLTKPFKDTLPYGILALVIMFLFTGVGFKYFDKKDL